ncbi:hypothetical protein BGX34_003738 [Mortierella sp. NVP85]|nr:hypothetical protein BGX34_003738 [Mortierella sp. NVP85]
MAMYPGGQYFDPSQTSTLDMAPDLSHSAMSTRSDVMDLDSRPIEAHRDGIRNYAQRLDPNQLERQRLYQLQIQQMQQDQDCPDYDYDYDNDPQDHVPAPSPYHHQQQQQQQHLHPYYTPSSPSRQHQNQFLSPPQPSYHHHQQTTDGHLMPPLTTERTMGTEMPSLAFSDGNSTTSQDQNTMSRPLASPTPSRSFPPPRNPYHHLHGSGDTSESGDGDYYLTSVLNMMAPAGVPPVALFDYDAQFTRRQRIGKGGNGFIKRAFWPLRQTEVVLKNLIESKLTPEKITEVFDKEVEVMNQCRQHDNIVQFYGVAIRSNEEHRGERYMIMQFYEHGDLVKLVEIDPHSPEAPTLTDKMYLALDIAQGLEHLYRCGYHHGDLHPKNVLIDIRRNRTPQQGRYLARLTDFGLRRKLNNMSAFSSQQFGGVWQFMAPERMVKHRPRYDVRCDIFALGVIYWFIMAGRYPFKDPGMFTPGAREGRIDGTPDWYYDIYTQAWSEDPKDRQQSLEEIVQAFRTNLGIQSMPSQMDPYGGAGGGAMHPYQPSPYGYDGNNTFHSYISVDGTGQPHHYSGSSAGSTIRGSPRMTTLTPGSPLQHPPSPLMSNSSSSSGRNNNRPSPMPGHALPTSIYR